MRSLSAPRSSAARPKTPFRAFLRIDHLEDRITPTGDLYYYLGADRIYLDTVPNELVVSASRPVVDQLTAPNGSLSGFTLQEQVRDGVFLLSGNAASTLSAPLPGADWSASSFRVSSTGQEVLILNEAVVALDAGVSPAAYFQTRPEVQSWRPLLGTPDQFVVTLAKGGAATLQFANSAHVDTGVAWATPNFFRSMQQFSTPNDPLFAQQWHLQNTGSNSGQSGAVAGADAHLTQAWNTSTGAGVVIAVVDDAIQLDHPDLNIFTNPGEVAGDGIDNDGNGYIDDVHGWSFSFNTPSVTPGANDEHGTSVSGIAAARGNNNLGVTGAAYSASVLPVQIFNGGAYAGDAQAASAIYYAAGRTANGLGTWNAAQIINCSWGGGSPNATLTAAFTYASNAARGGQGVATFISTGNDYNSAVSYPANLSGTLSGVIAVGASNDIDTRAGYSNYGPQVDIVAPSSDFNRGPGDSNLSLATTTTDRTGTLGYNPAGDYTTNLFATGFGGTSSASPLAAGVGAVVLSYRPTMTAAQLKTLLRATADKVGGVTYTGGFNLEYGYGRINAAAAIAAAGFGVASTSPAVGSTVTAPPTVFTVTFSAAVNAATLQPSDFKVNGISATSVSLSGSTATFTFATSPVTVQGAQTMTVAAGAVSSTSGELVQAFSGQFLYDAVALAVTATVPANGGTFTLPGPFTFDVVFNEAIAAGSVGTGDLSLTVGTVTGAFALNATTARYTISGITAEGSVGITLLAGAVTDTFGNPNAAAFSGTYQIDIGSVPFPVPLVAVNPPGSLIYDRSTTGVINFVGDIDEFRINLDAGQSYTIYVVPNGAPAGLSLGYMEFVRSDGVSDGAYYTGLRDYPITQSGVYRFRVGTVGTPGGYTLRILGNADIEDEGPFGAFGLNDTPATAQFLGYTPVALDTTLAHANRIAVVGATDPATGGAPIAEVEPNNSRAAAQNLELAAWSLAANGNIQNATTVPHVTISGTGNGTFDYYSFVVTTPGSIGYFDIDGANFDTELFLYNSAGVLVASNDDAGGDAGSSSGLDSFISYTFPAVGTYVIAVGQYDSFDSGGAVGGSAPPTGGVYTLHASVANHAVPPGAPDFYRFTATAGQRVSLALTNLATGNVDVQLIAPNGTTVLASGVAAANLNEVISNFLIGTTDTYYVKITGDASIPYSLVVTRDAVFDTEGNSTQATAQTLTGAQGALGQVQGGSGVGYNFESGLQGWAVNNNVLGTGASAGLWHLSTRRGGETGHSPVTSFYYGSEATGSYDTGVRNAGNITSPAFVVPTGANLTFNYLKLTENFSPYDNLSVLVSTNGFATSTTLLASLSDAGAWTVASASLAAFAGQTVQMRFVFDTVDGSFNGYEGVYIDDVTVGSVANDDWYKVTLAAGETVLDVETTTPASGPGEFVNTLNPKIQLFNAAGVDVTPTVTILGDGRNEKFRATGLTPGATYFIKVTGEGGTTGEYFVGVKALGTPTPTVLVDNTNPLGFRVVGSGWDLNATGYGGSSRSHAAGTGSTYAQWTYGQNFVAGTSYAFYVTWTANPANASNATYAIFDGATQIGTVVLNQQLTPNDVLVNGSLWETLFVYTATATGYKTITVRLSDAANGRVIADALFDPPLNEVAPVAGALPAADPEVVAAPLAVTVSVPVAPARPLPGSVVESVPAAPAARKPVFGWLETAPVLAIAASMAPTTAAAPTARKTVSATDPMQFAGPKLLAPVAIEAAAGTKLVRDPLGLTDLLLDDVI